MMIEHTFASHSLFYHGEIELEADVTSVSTNGMLERRKRRRRRGKNPKIKRCHICDRKKKEWRIRQIFNYKIMIVNDRKICNWSVFDI